MAYTGKMQREVFHPAPEQIGLSGVFDALSDPIRRLIVARLSEQGELNCSCFLDFGSKTAISYHLARLREAGITATRIAGKLHFITLREADLEQRFPGLLKPVIAGAREETNALENAGGKGGMPPARVGDDLRKGAHQKVAAPRQPAKKTARRKPVAA